MRNCCLLNVLLSIGKALVEYFLSLLPCLSACRPLVRFLPVPVEPCYLPINTDITSYPRTYSPNPQKLLYFYSAGVLYPTLWFAILTDRLLSTYQTRLAHCPIGTPPQGSRSFYVIIQNLAHSHFLFFARLTPTIFLHTLHLYLSYHNLELPSPLFI